MLHAGRRAALPVRPRRPRPARPRASTTTSTASSIALSSALGIETLPAEEAEPLLRRLQPRHPRARRARSSCGAPSSLDAPRAPTSTTSSTHGALGVSLPATALADRRGLRHVAPLLDRLEARGAPLFVHPGPAYVAPSAPPWWPALTSYVADMSAAWHAFATWGRPRHPQLRIVYAMLAGGAPLHAERLVAARRPGGGDPRPARLVRRLLLRPARARRDDPRDRDRPPALRLDRPVAAPPATAALGDAVTHALTVTERRVGVLGARDGGGAGVNTQELTEFVQGLATKPESWRHLVEHDRAARTYSELLRDDNVAAWLICWMDEHDTGFHDHDVSAGAVAVVRAGGRERPARARREPSTARARPRQHVLRRRRPRRASSSACCVRAPTSPRDPARPSRAAASRAP